MKSANQKSMHCHGQSVGSAAGFLTDLFVRPADEHERVDARLRRRAVTARGGRQRRARGHSGGEVSTSMRCFARAVVSVGLFVNFVAHKGTGRGPAHVKR